MTASFERTFTVASPRELLWFYVVAPLVASPLMASEAFTAGGAVPIARAIAALYVPFLGIPAAIHAARVWVLPWLARRRGGASASLQVAAMSVTAAVAAAPIKPLHDVISGRVEGWAEWMASAVIVTWVFALPTVVIAEINERAARATLAEKHEALRAQLDALQARTNPHFLFNSLNAVAELIHRDPRLAEQTVERLSEILRYALSSSGVRAVPLSREIEIVCDYLGIEQARFGDRLRVSVEVEPAVDGHEVPPLVLQPLVENAVLHGARGDGRPTHVVVRAARAGDAVEMVVDDDGPGPGASRHRGTGTALRDLRARLALLHGDGAKLELFERPGGGARAVLLLPRGRSA